MRTVNRKAFDSIPKIIKEMELIEFLSSYYDSFNSLKNCIVSYKERN